MKQWANAFWYMILLHFFLLSSSSCLVFIKIGTLSIYIFYSCQIHTRTPCSRFLRTLAHQIAMRHIPSARHLCCCRFLLCCQKLWLIITLYSKSVLNRKTTHTQSLSHFCRNTHAERERENDVARVERQLDWWMLCVAFNSHPS